MAPAVRVAFGLRSHSGWAVLVAVSDPSASPVVVDRRRLTLCDESFPRQPYHAAENLSPANAVALIAGSLETAHRLGREGLRAAVKDRRLAGHTLVGAGLLLGSARALPRELPAILRSHPLIHAAEGEMYRGVLRTACERSGVAVVGLCERDLEAEATRRLRVSRAEVRARLTALGKPVGPPWSQDEKLAALAGWLVLSGTSA